MSITTTFNPPQPSDSPAVFNSKAFSTLGGINTWSTEANALAEAVNADADTATAKASEASGFASEALASKNSSSNSAGVATSKAGEAADSASDAIAAKLAAEEAASHVSGTNTGDQTALTTPNTPAGSLAATNVQAALNELDTEKAPLASPTFTGTVSGITKSMVGLGNVDNTSDANKPASTATQAALNDKVGLSGDQTIGGTKTFSNNVGIGAAPSTYGNTKQLKIGETTFIHGDGVVFNWQSAYCNNVVQNNNDFIYANTGQAGGVYVQAGGAHNFYSAPIGVAGAAATPTLQMEITAAGQVLATNSTGLGYGAGSGGTVTQATSKTTPVTLNKICGLITMHNAALAAGASVIFKVNNSLVTGADSISTMTVDEFGSIYTASALSVWGGYFFIRVTNITAGSLSQAVSVNFQVHKGSLS